MLSFLSVGIEPFQPKTRTIMINGSLSRSLRFQVPILLFAYLVPLPAEGLFARMLLGTSIFFFLSTILAPFSLGLIWLGRCRVLIEEGEILPVWSEGLEAPSSVAAVARRRMIFHASLRDRTAVRFRTDIPLRRMPGEGGADAWLLYGLPLRHLFMHFGGKTFRFPMTYEERFRILFM